MSPSERPQQSRSRAALRCLALLASLLVPVGSARAEEDAPSAASLWQRGRILIAGSLSGSWSNDTSPYGALKRWQVYGYPSASYLVRDRIALGLSLGGGASRTDIAGVLVTDYGLIIAPKPCSRCR
ncbi:MAG TPA: hypothetical protein VFZ61_13725 [Polyangiales bacterium]